LFLLGRTDGAVLALNALLGLGTASAPVLVAIVMSMGVWWLPPVVVVCILVLIFAIVVMEALKAGPAMTAGSGPPRPIGARNLPGRFWLYAAAVFLNGILETMNGNWATLYLPGGSACRRGAPTWHLPPSRRW
jgi:hypothetical protein